MWYPLRGCILKNMHVGFPQQPDKLVFVEMFRRAGPPPYAPSQTGVCIDNGTIPSPGGRGTAKRWMRNGDTFPFLMQSSQRVQPFPMYLFNEMHTDSEHIAVPHPPQCAHWGTFPPFQNHPRRGYHILYLISRILNLRSGPGPTGTCGNDGRGSVQKNVKKPCHPIDNRVWAQYNTAILYHINLVGKLRKGERGS